MITIVTDKPRVWTGPSSGDCVHTSEVTPSISLLDMQVTGSPPLASIERVDRRCGVNGADSSNVSAAVHDLRFHDQSVTGMNATRRCHVRQRRATTRKMVTMATMHQNVHFEARRTLGGGCRLENKAARWGLGICRNTLMMPE